VPSLLLFWLILAKLAQTGFELRNVLAQTLAEILPTQSSGVVSSAVQQTGSMLGLSGVALSITSAVWAALNGMWAVITGLNKAYGVKEGRPAWKAFLVSAWLMAVWGVLGFIALVAVVFGAKIGALASGGALHVLWPVLHGVVAVVVLLVGFAIIYRFGPHLEGQEMQWSTPGAVIGVALWIASAVGFRIYLEHFNSYNRIYGQLGSVAILMLWLYISGAAILVGGEVNAVIEHAAAERGDIHARAPGERRPGEHRRPRRPAA
jgi:membrane protein